MSVTPSKRAIGSVEPSENRATINSSFKGTIEPRVDLQGPPTFDAINKRRSAKNIRGSPSADNADTLREPDDEKSSEWDSANTLAPLSLPLQITDSPSINPNARKPAFVANTCYGMIHNARTKILDAAALRREAIGDSIIVPSFYVLKHHFKAQSIFFKSSSGEDFAVLNEETTKILQELSRLNSCRFETYSAVKEWDTLFDNRSRTEKKYLLIDVVLYGPKPLRNAVGELLSTSRIYLQHPCNREADTEYDNPHFLSFTDPPSTSRSSDGVPSGTTIPQTNSNPAILNGIKSAEMETTQAQIHHKIAKVFDSLTRSKKLKRVEADIKVTTPLLPHQEEALDFMSQREVGPVPDEYSLWKSATQGNQLCYEHVITGLKSREASVETVGGILADDMGLGKTLTVISTIIRTAKVARSFSEDDKWTANHSETEDKSRPVLSRSTLVIVPSPLLLDGWLEEIKTHCDGTLNINVYHGRGRELDPAALGDSDIVLSTYHTIAADALDTESPLNRMTWFRIVLDEAHIIRRMSTKLCKAVSRLSANIRWCLTGTPIQNSLEDLASLVAFVHGGHPAPLDNLVEFRKHIVAPLMKGSDQGLENIRILLESICLRRTKKLLNLPDVFDSDRLVEFSDAEKLQYRATQTEMINTVRQYDSQARNEKGYFGIFQLQLQLRRLCNHGTFQRQASQTLENDLLFDPEEALQLLRTKNAAKCIHCNVKITGLSAIEDKVSGVFTACGHLLCTACVPRFENALQPELGSGLRCSICQRALSSNYLAGWKESSIPNQANPSTNPKIFEEHGLSSKVAALLNDIKNNKSKGKSIVFSCWTRSLDLVGHYLTSQNIPFARIDGTNSLSQRQHILANYHSDPLVRILLMTTGTGAVGLNLTIANCVYILEPQWNPMVENQAIARVLRLGQERDVKVVRYIMRGTVEEKMRSQQTRKLDFAKLGWREEE